ncbi:MAG TPA: hypothetical protein VFD32_22015 [Dehalococcoidia bacterium]|nr:hypothetical protein [Dehalococcoidia bacterium]
MIIERLVWRAKFGMGDQVAEAFKRWRTEMAPRFDLTARIMVDLTGPMFTVVVETEYRDMAHVAEMTAQLRALYGDAEFQQWFGSWQGAVEGGSRELYQAVE